MKAKVDGKKKESKEKGANVRTARTLSDSRISTVALKSYLPPASIGIWATTEGTKLMIFLWKAAEKPRVAHTAYSAEGRRGVAIAPYSKS